MPSSSSSPTPHPSPLPDDVVLSVRNVSKKFSRNLKRSMWYGMRDLACNLLGLTEVPKPPRPGAPASDGRLGLRRDEFWAVDNISFDLKKGEILGLIGANGSGKTTLLRVITGIYPPDHGQVAIRGRLSALIALGAGFHGHMTGAENIYMNGTVLGLTRRQIAEKYDDIVSFAEIGEFLNAPVSTYSSGMTVRLGFAIAVHSLTDLVLVDEILAVGDARFQRKCLNHIRALRHEGVSFILVSHNMQNIESMADRVVLLDHGRCVTIGTPDKVVPTYDLMQIQGGKALPPVSLEPSALANDSDSLQLVHRYEDFGTDEITVVKLRVLDRASQPSKEFHLDAITAIELEFLAPVALVDAFLWVTFIHVQDPANLEGDVPCVGVRMRFSATQGRTNLRLDLGAVFLTTGIYKLSVAIFDDCYVNPYTQGRYGYLTVHHDIPTMLRTGMGTPFMWLQPAVRILEGDVAIMAEGDATAKRSHERN